MRLTGWDAIRYAEENDLLLSKYTDPMEEARDGLTPEEARRVALEDLMLIYVEVQTPQQQFVEAVGGEREAIECEHQVLSGGREFLPLCAIEVLEGKPATAEYWQWLLKQVEQQKAGQ